MEKSQAAEAIDSYFLRRGRTRFQPANAERQYDRTLPKVRFWRFPDGSAVRFDAGDVQEF